ncbi:hypothetical protein ACFEMC_05540 [Kineococcus sp. DHX-1]|uniref:hypothetical protein n=1 Tax=Kineococcus sp. DHX-1 TaxID=3349638 RepID=UPI0036D2256E
MSIDRDDQAGQRTAGLRRVMQYLGLSYAPGGEPRKRGPSRYWAGRSVSRRLDEDLDELRRRVDDLERRQER